MEVSAVEESVENEIEVGWTELEAVHDSEAVSHVISRTSMDITEGTIVERAVENESAEMERGSEETVFGDEDDDSWVNLEYVENHMRHAGSNAGPVSFKDMPMVIGRDLFANYDAHKKRKLVSRGHALIEAKRNSSGYVDYYLRDTSVNGTFLGANRLAPDGPPAKLEHGDVIGILTSHSSPLETYSAYGEYFTVTLGLRWLRPNADPEKKDPSVSQEHHIPILSRLHSEYAPGTFVDQGYSDSDDDEGRSTQKTDITQKSGSSRSSRSTSAKGSVSAHSTPARIRSSGTKVAQTSPRRKRGNGDSRRITLTSKRRSKSGNDTDDTDGDDEREDGENMAGNRTSEDKKRTPIIAISKPVFDDGLSSPSSSSRTPNAKAGEYWTTPKPSTTRRGTPLRSLTFPAPSSEASTPAPGSYWDVTPGSGRERKRARMPLASESADELEPAKKVRAE